MDGNFQIQDDLIFIYVGKKTFSVTAIKNYYLKILAYVF